jgi:RNA polymerase sigma factor (sigma-70 family)
MSMSASRPRITYDRIAAASSGVRSQNSRSRHELNVTDVEVWSDDDLLGERRPGIAGAAFAEFYARHERAVLAYFRRRTPTSELAADLAAETFAQALGSRGRFRPRGRSTDASVAWLYGIAANVLSHSVRRGRVEDRARVRLGLPQVLLSDEAIEAIEAMGGDRGAETALESLPAEQRAAVYARIVDERTYPQIANDLRCSEAVARKRVSRGLATLRKTIEEPA